MALRMKSNPTSRISTDRRPRSRWLGDNALVMLPNNPADRLATIMSILRTQDANQQVKVSFLNVLGFPASERPETFFRAFGQLQELPSVVEVAVRAHAHPDHHDLDLYLSWLGPITSALQQGQGLNGKTLEVLSAYGDDDVRALRFCGSLLSAAGHEERVDQGLIDELQQKVDFLENEVTAADSLPSDLKSFILDQLDCIRYALREFNIRGPHAMADVLERIVGAASAHSDLGGDANDESQSFLQKFGQVIDLADRIGKAAQSISGGILSIAGAAVVVSALMRGDVPPADLPLPALPPAVVQSVDGASPNSEPPSGTPDSPMDVQSFSLE